MAIMSYLPLILADRGMSWAELSRQTGVSYKTLWRLNIMKFDDHDHLPSAGTIDAICRGLDIDVDELFGYVTDDQAEAIAAAS